jgi:ubiquinone/menaquinone biosynthesis C-methylase UbiE
MNSISNQATARIRSEGRIDSGPPLESQAWREVYGQESERRRRLNAMPRKLAVVGINTADRNDAILDLCCGHGEALQTLYRMGFRNLTGVDIDVDDALAVDPRFRVLASDAKCTPYPDASFDWILNIHAMHHFATAQNVEVFLNECWRLLKPGGRLSIIDFPNNHRIQLAFWWFRQNLGLWTSHFKAFGHHIQEEWYFLKDYLLQWPKTCDLLFKGPFEVEIYRQRMIYFYLTLRKPVRP